MNQSEKCVYCGTLFDSTKGEGDHIIPVQLGEFRKDVRFRRICPSCNNKIGKSEQQFLLCGPVSFFKDIVKPKIPPKRERGHSKLKAVLGVPTPQATNDCGDHRQLVKRSKDNPTDVFPVDQIVIHDEQENEFFIELFPGMRPEQLKERIAKKVINKIVKTWFHCDTIHESEYRQLIEKTWPTLEIHNLPGTEAGITKINGRIAFKVNDHYFRAVAKIAFHYYLLHSHRGFRGDEQFFEQIRYFIMNGGDKDIFFDQSGPQFKMPFGKISSGGVITPKQWCHIIAADETDRMAVVYLQLFVGRGCIPRYHYIKLADIDSKVYVPNSTWGHIYLYDESPVADKYAGRVEEAQITRIR